jgi:hypothetical protein
MSVAGINFNPEPGIQKPSEKRRDAETAENRKVKPTPDNPAFRVRHRDRKSLRLLAFSAALSRTAGFRPNSVQWFRLRPPCGQIQEYCMTKKMNLAASRDQFPIRQMPRIFFALLTALVFLSGPVGAQSPAPTLETTARELAQLDVRRYEIHRAHLDAPTLPEAALAEIAALNESALAFIDRYRNATDPAAGGTMYQLHDRRRQLVAAEIGPAWNRLMLERFPLPEQIRRDFTNDARYAAALLVVGYEFALGRTIRPPRSPELEARDALYSQAVEAAQAPYKAKGEQSREWRKFEHDMLASSQSAAFKREVLGRYVPLFASFVRDDPVTAQERAEARLSATTKWLFVPAWGDEFDDLIIFRGHVLIVVVAVLTIAGGIVAPVWLSRRRGRQHNAPRGQQPVVSPLALPPDLQMPQLPAGLRLNLFVENARVLDLQTWSETSVSWQSSSGNQHVAPQVSVTTSTVQKDRLWVETIDGLEKAWTISGGVFAANRGHFLTWIQARMKNGDVLPCLAFNHNTQQWYERAWLAEFQRGFWKHWILLNLLWIGPGCFALGWLLLNMRESENLAVSLLGTLVVSSFVWTGLTHAWITWRRGRAWQKLYRPRVLDWLKGLSTPLTESM